MTSPIPSYRMNDGLDIPAFGLGMWNLQEGREAETAVRHALDAGYRLFDTAALYGNERSLGRAVRDSSIPRGEVFVTTKVWNSDHGYEQALRAFDESLRRLDLDYVDLYLIHWPVESERLDTWRALESIREAGRCRSIGVSNYMVRHLEELLDHSEVLPAVNQIELHPWNYASRKATVDLCRRKGILVEAYSPLTKGRMLRDRQLDEIATAHEKTPAQVLLRWGIQHGFVEIPKSSRSERIRENVAIFDFELSGDDMDTLDSLDRALATSWDPTGTP